MNPIQLYLDKVNQRYQTGIATEHSYRGDLQGLLETLLPDILVTNEPTRIQCGAPDYILTRNGLDIGWIEAKDIGKALDSKEFKSQFDRYRAALPNLIITDYLQFDFYRVGEKVASIKLAQLVNNNLQALPDNFAQFLNLIKDFALYVSQTISSASLLSKLMAAKARLLANVIENALNSDEENAADSSLKEQFAAFKAILLHEIKPSEFADIYAQTIAYGMFAARLHHDEAETFSRIEAANKISLSNPFLRKLFQYIAGFDLDARIVWIVNALADIFRAVDAKRVMQNFGNSTQQTDPIIHFYETFLAEYDPKLRKSRGVWYTPEPVVDFIVRAVDEILKTQFHLKDGLADTGKTSIEVEEKVLKGRGKTKFTALEKQQREVHKVQILDPATGTGTFLAAIVKFIYENEFQTMQGVWSSYVENDLIPRLNGFEILMASYAMAHLKLDLLLTETGYQPQQPQRFNIYLTNSLEEHHPDTQSLFATWLSQEANEANHIKRDTPVMVVMGNPPYSVSSSNKGEWISALLQDYKKDLNEKNIQPLSDDYIKFIRYGSYFIEKNGAGILAYISNNSFIDGVIHRQMRKALLETFDSIYILDLHGNSKKKESAPDGGKDENVFDIMQGVSINIFVKHSKTAKAVLLQRSSAIEAGSDELASVFHFDLFGKRKDKYQFLFENGLSSVAWNKIDCRAPDYFFVTKTFDVQKKYEEGFLINQLFPLNASGITTERDHLTIKFNKNDLIAIAKDILALSENDFRNKHTPKPDGRDWKISFAKQDIISNVGEITPILYRPFDVRNTIYTGKSKGFMAYPRNEVMQHLLKTDNFAFNCLRQSRSDEIGTFLVSNTIVCKDAVSLLDRCTVFPLYLYPEESKQQTLDATTGRKPNLNPDIVKQVAAHLGLNFTPEKTECRDAKYCVSTEFCPLDLLDYIYAVLHSPTYRQTYKEFLKIDFPRVPYPNQETFWQLVKLGGELRQLHLLESPELENKKLTTTYPVSGDNKITRKIHKTDYETTTENSGRVWINDSQYFDNVPQTAWEFYIGGYQPAQKWLKDRHERELNRDDILHYQKIIKALTETARIMNEIDLIPL
jgi:predicted helicase